MIKILILVAVAGVTSSIGVFLSANKKKRMAVFAELYEFNEELLLNLKFTRAPVAEIAKKYKFMPDILGGKQLLEGEDGDIIRDYAKNLGKSDAISQIDYLNDRKSVLSKRREESAETYKKYSSLYIKIFFLLGVLLAVLLA